MLYDVFYDLVGISSVAAIVTGVRINRPDYPLPWHLFALGELLFVAGDMTLNFYENVLHIPAPFPPISGIFWLSGYPSLALGLALLIRRRAPRRQGRETRERCRSESPRRDVEPVPRRASAPRIGWE